MELIKSWFFLALNLFLSIIKKLGGKQRNTRDFLREFGEEGLVPVTGTLSDAILKQTKCVGCGYCDINGDFSLIPHITRFLPELKDTLQEIKEKDVSKFHCPFGVDVNIWKNVTEPA